MMRKPSNLAQWCLLHDAAVRLDGVLQPVPPRRQGQSRPGCPSPCHQALKPCPASRRLRVRYPGAAKHLAVTSECHPNPQIPPKSPNPTWHLEEEGGQLKPP